MQQFYKLIHEDYISLNKDFVDNPILNQIYGVDDENIMVDDIPKGCEKGEAQPTWLIRSNHLFLHIDIIWNGDTIMILLN